MGFHCSYEFLCEAEPRFGRIADLPWDRGIFGFPCADYQLGDVGFLEHNQPRWQSLVTQWAEANGSLLIACGTEASNRDAAKVLSESGFFAVDSSIKATLVRLQAARLPTVRQCFRPATAEDMSRVKQIARSAFRFGRYHTDPFFPPHLADRRYVHWVENAFASADEHSHLLVFGESNDVGGFFHAVVRGTEGDLRLAAVDPDIPRGVAGIDLYVNALKLLQGLGVKRVTAKLSPLNTAVLNVYVLLGFRFSKPTVTYHWYASGARAVFDAHLQDAAAIG